MAMDEKLDLILVELRSVKSDVGEMKAHMNALEGKMNALETRMNEVETEMKAFKADINVFREEVHDYKIVAEEAVNKTIKLLGEAVKINADRYDRMDFEGMRRNTEIAVAMTQMVNDRLNFIEKTVVRQ